MAKNKKVVASTDDYTIFARRDGRYQVVAADGNSVNGDDKVAILLQHELITAAAPKAPEPEAEPEASEDAADEASAEDSSAEDAAEDEAS